MLKLMVIAIVQQFTDHPALYTNRIKSDRVTVTL